MELTISMEIKMNKFVHATAFAAGIMVSGIAIAANQGSVGGISTGDLNVEVTINDEVRISGLSDITGAFDGTNDFVGASTVCVYRNGTGLYAITATGDGGGNAFTITNTGLPVIPYTVEWDDRSGGGFTSMATGVQLTGQTGADTASDTCGGGGDNADVQVTVDAGDLITSPAGLLIGVLTLEVAPE